MKKINILTILLLGFVFSCKSPEWPQYLGSDRNATIDDEILSGWPEEGPKKLWEDSVGSGFGGVSISNDEVFILDRIEGENDLMRCLDLNTGHEKWSFSYDAKGKLPYPGSRSVPTVDKKYVWSIGPFGQMYCFDRMSHLPIWNKNLVLEFDADSMYFGISQSPILYKNYIIAATQGKKAGVVAMDKKTGEVIWASRKLSGSACQVSPTIGKIHGIDQIIMLSQYDKKDSTLTNEVVAFDANTGNELWTYHGLHSFSLIAPPVVLDNNRILISDCSYNDKFEPVTALLEIEKEKDRFTVKELFLTDKAGCKMHPPVVHNGYIYLNDNGRPNSMKCLSMNGEVVWSSDTVSFEMGSILLIGDKIINQNGKNGEICLIQASADGYKELGRAGFFDSKKSQAWAPMAYCDGKLIIRDNEKMVCVDLKNP